MEMSIFRLYDRQIKSAAGIVWLLFANTYAYYCNRIGTAKTNMISEKMQQTKNRKLFIAGFILMLLLAFFQCFRVAHHVVWPHDPDLYRDMAFIQGVLDGDYGQDPNYAGASLWYNPLLFSIEALIVKFTGLPVHIVVSRAGIYLNLLGPIAFFILTVVFFDLRIALAATLSYLFLATGNIPGSAAATYSPWLLPVCFAQFTFYVSLIFAYKAFSTQKYGWFAVLGASVGIGFLAHTGPAVLMILILISLQVGNIAKAIRDKQRPLVNKYFLQGLTAFGAFFIAGLPLLYSIVFKYHLHYVNKEIFEFRAGIFILPNIRQFIKENVSFSLLISIVGFVWFYREFRETVIRKIILNWLFVSGFMFVYTSALPKLHEMHINLPDTIPSYHYFFYIKALQSVFYGFGLTFLIGYLLRWIDRRISNKRIQRENVASFNNLVFVFCILLCAIVYFPLYKNRTDFTPHWEPSLTAGVFTDRIQTYDYIIHHINPEKVILCEESANDFPVMASGRKMVSASMLFSNPFFDFNVRYADRNSMLEFLKTGEPKSARQLFDKYQVSYVLVTNEELKQYKLPSPLLKGPVHANGMYTLFSVNAD